MFLSDMSVRRPVAMTALILVMLVFGLMAYPRLGVDLVPRVEFPYVTVLAVYPGAAPDEIETAVARKIEDAVASIDGIRHIDSTSMDGVCQTLIEFEMGRDVDIAAMDVREKIGLIRSDLPEAVEEPKILKFDVNARPVVTLALAGELSVDDLFDYADNRLRDRLSTLPGVASVEIVGGARREVHVLADRGTLAARGLTTVDLAEAVRAANVTVPGGDIRDSGRELSVTFDAEADAIEDLGDIEVGPPGGPRVYLRNVAAIQTGTETRNTAAFVDGRPAVAVKVVKKGEANAARVVAGVRRAVDELRPELPGGMELVWFRDDADFVMSSVYDAWSSVGYGLLLTGLILLVFLQDVRTALIAFLSIPVSIFISFAVMQAFGYTLNIITLSAFGISVGILVTNSIVVLENVSRRFTGAAGVREEVRLATSQVAVAVSASALTNVVVFVPIATMRSLSGRFLAPFAMTVAAATFVSLFISFTLTPILAAWMLRRDPRVNRALRTFLAPWERVYGRLERAYAGSLRRAARFAVPAAAGTVALLAAGLALVAPRLKMDFIPASDQGELSARLEYPADFSLAETTRRANAVAERLAAHPEARHALTVVGKVQGLLGQVSEGRHLAEINVKMTAKTERRQTIDTLREDCRLLVQSEPGCRFAVLVPSGIGGSSKMIEANISGPDLDELNRLGTGAARLAEANPMLVDVEHTVRLGKPEIRVSPFRAVLRDLRLPAGRLGAMLRGNLEGLIASTYRKGDRTYDIRVKLREEPGRGQVAAMNLPGPDGRPTPLPAVAALVPGQKPSQIIRSEKQRIVKLYADLASGAGLGNAVQHLRAEVEPTMPAGYRLRFAGMAERMAESFGEFRGVTLTAVALTYLLMAAMLESWLQPLLILMTVPFAYLGLFLAIYLSGTSLSIFGLLAGIMLIGVVVNNAILVIDEVNQSRSRQADLTRREAMLQAARNKFRPILMTSAAAVLGMVPMATGHGLGSELRASIGIGSVGGMILSSALSLYLIPLLYLAFVGRKR